MPETPFLLSYKIAGEGNPLVLLHGFLESTTMWEYLELQTNFQLVLIDLPGHGQSAHTPTCTSIEHMASCVQFTLTEIGLKNFDLIGHSMGGYVALSFVEQFGIHGQLILLNSNSWTDDTQKQADRLRVANLVLHNKNLFIREAIPGLFTDSKKYSKEIASLKKEALAIPAEHIAACSVAMRNRKDQEATLLLLKNKISIFQGELDKLCPLQKMETLTKKLKLNCVLIPNAGHMSYIESPCAVREAIVEALAS